MDKSARITGGCLCGKIRYEVSAPMTDPHYCHCRTCQKASGAPVIAGAFAARNTFRFTEGAPTIFRSSPIIERGFCGGCGTYLIYRPLIPEWSAWMIVTIASLDRPECLPPQRHYGIESRIKWLDIRDDFQRERYEEDFIDILVNGSPDERQAVLDRFGLG